MVGREIGRELERHESQRAYFLRPSLSTVSGYTLFPGRTLLARAALRNACCIPESGVAVTVLSAVSPRGKWLHYTSVARFNALFPLPWPRNAFRRQLMLDAKGSTGKVRKEIASLRLSHCETERPLLSLFQSNATFERLCGW